MMKKCATEKPRFIIDSNILIESKRIDYGFDLCPGFWDLMKKSFKCGLVVSHAKVLRELKKIQDDVYAWASDLPKACFPKETDEELAEYLKLCGWVRSANRFKQAAVDRFYESDYADPWICAKAKVQGLTLVTQEVSQPDSRKDVKLPDACIAAGVSYCNKYNMLRALRAKFVLEESHQFAV